MEYICRTVMCLSEKPHCWTQTQWSEWDSCSQGYIKWHLCICNNNHLDMPSTESHRWLIESDEAFWLSCFLVSPLGDPCPVFRPITFNNKNDRDKGEGICIIRMSVSVFFLISKLYLGRIVWPYIFFFFLISALLKQSYSLTHSQLEAAESNYSLPLLATE